MKIKKKIVTIIMTGVVIFIMGRIFSGPSQSLRDQIVISNGQNRYTLVSSENSQLNFTMLNEKHEIISEQTVNAGIRAFNSNNQNYFSIATKKNLYIYTQENEFLNRIVHPRQSFIFAHTLDNQNFYYIVQSRPEHALCINSECTDFSNMGLILDQNTQQFLSIAVLENILLINVIENNGQFAAYEVNLDNMTFIKKHEFEGEVMVIANQWYVHKQTAKFFDQELELSYHNNFARLDENLQIVDEFKLGEFESFRILNKYNDYVYLQVINEDLTSTLLQYNIKTKTLLNSIELNSVEGQSVANTDILFDFNGKTISILNSHLAQNYQYDVYDLYLEQIDQISSNKRLRQLFSFN